MKYLPLPLLLVLTLAAGPALADDDPFANDNQPEAERSKSPNSPVRVSFTTDLVDDFPIAITATTTEEGMEFTLGPKEDGYYCSLFAELERIDNGSIKISTTFSEETEVSYAQSEGAVRRVGFENLSVVLEPGEEEVLFSSGDKTFVIELLEPKGQ